PLTITSTTFPVSASVPGCCSHTVVGAYSLSPDGLVATFTPAEILTPNSSHSVQVNTGAKDRAGNPLFNTFSSSFTTEESLDKTAPSVVSVSVVPGFSGLGINGRVCVKFSETIDPTTINAQTVVLSAGAVPIEIERNLSLMNQVLCVKPANLF